MAAIDELKALADSLPPEVKPVAADVVDVVAAIAHTLEAAGVKIPAPVDTAVQAAEEATDDSETVGSAVFDVAGQGSQESPESSEPSAVEPPTSLEEEVKAKRDELQALEVQLADSHKTQHVADVPPVDPPPVV